MNWVKNLLQNFNFIYRRILGEYNSSLSRMNLKYAQGMTESPAKDSGRPLSISDEEERKGVPEGCWLSMDPHVQHRDNVSQ